MKAKHEAIQNLAGVDLELSRKETRIRVARK